MLGLNLSLIRGTGPVTGPPPVITSTDTVSLAENIINALTLTADNGPVTWSITGGTDADKFTIAGGNTLRFISTPSYEDPTDVDEDNVYGVHVTATNAFGTDAMTINVTIGDSTEGNEGSWTVIAGNTNPGTGQLSITNATAGLTLPGNGQNGSNWYIKFFDTTKGGANSPDFVTAAPKGRILTITNITTDEEISYVVDAISYNTARYDLYVEPTATVTLFPGQSSLILTAGDVLRITITANQVTTVTYNATGGTWGLDNTGPNFNYNVSYSGVETDARTFFGLDATDLAVISPNLGGSSYAHYFVFKTQGFGFDTASGANLTYNAPISDPTINVTEQGTVGIAKTITLGSGGSHPNSVTVSNGIATLSAEFDEYGVVASTTANSGYTHIGSGVFTHETPGVRDAFSVSAGMGVIVSQNTGTDPAQEVTELVLSVSETPNGGTLELNALATINWDDTAEMIDTSLMANLSRLTTTTGSGTYIDPYVITDQTFIEKDDLTITANTLTYAGDPNFAATTPA